MIQSAFFYLFATVMLLSAFRVVTARNPVHAVLFLMLTFIQAAGLWLMLYAEFLGIVLVLVYLGAVMVMFLFVIMMLNLKIQRPRSFWKHFPLALLLGAVIVAEMVYVLMRTFSKAPSQPMAMPPQADGSNIKALGLLLYEHYVYPVQIAGVILLVGMIAAIALAFYRRAGSKAINPALQVAVKPSEQLIVLQMPSIRPAVDPAADGASQTAAAQQAEGGAQEEKKS